MKDKTEAMRRHRAGNDFTPTGAKSLPIESVSKLGLQKALEKAAAATGAAERTLRNAFEDAARVGGR